MFTLSCVCRLLFCYCLCYYVLIVLSDVMACWYNYVHLINVCFLMKTKSVSFPDSFPASCVNYPFLIFTLIFVFLFITFSISPLSHYVHVFFACMHVQMSCMWCVSGIVLTCTVFLFHFHFIALITFMGPQEVMNHYIKSVCCQNLVSFYLLISEIIFCRYVGGCYLSLYSCDSTSCFGNLIL